MPYYRDLREYLQALDRAGKLRRVEIPINKDTELHPLVRWQFRGLPEHQRTGFLFERLTDQSGKVYNGRCATAITGASPEVYAIGMQCTPAEIQRRWVEAYRKPIPPRLVPTGPVKEEIHLGAGLTEHGGMNEFPIPLASNGWEALPRLTAIAWHSRDPETGVLNVGTYNGTVLGPTTTSCRCGLSNAQMWTHWDKAKALGRPLPAAIVIGAVPAVSMTSVARIPYGVCELDIAGGIAGEPIEVVRCETSDLVVPATAEVVIEGEIRTDCLVPDAASGEHAGYMMLGEEVFVFDVKCITHRRNPIWHDFISQMPPSESSTIRKTALEGRLLDFLINSCGIPQVKQVAAHHCGGGKRIVVVQLRKLGGKRPHNSIVWRSLTATLSVASDWPKMVIAVDEDIDPWDLESVFWAVSFRYQPHRDTKILQGRTGDIDASTGAYGEDPAERLYPTSRTGPQGGSAILMDATIKWDYTPIALPKQPYMEHARALWEKLGFPELTPKMPWYGESLGYWPEEYAEQAELAEQGDFDGVARALMARLRSV